MSVDLRKHPLDILGEMIRSVNPDLEEVGKDNLIIRNIKLLSETEAELEIDMVGGESEVDGDYVKFKCPRVDIEYIFSLLDSNLGTSEIDLVIGEEGFEALATSKGKSQLSREAVDFFLDKYGFNTDGGNFTIGVRGRRMHFGVAETSWYTKGPFPGGCTRFISPKRDWGGHSASFILRETFFAKKGKITISARSDDYVTVYFNGVKDTRYYGWRYIREYEYEVDDGWVDIVIISQNANDGGAFIAYHIENNDTFVTNTDKTTYFKLNGTNPEPPASLLEDVDLYLQANHYLYSGNIKLKK